MGRLRWLLSVFTCQLRQTVQIQLEYPAFLLAWVLMIPLQYLGTVALLGTIGSRFGGLGGWTADQVAFVYGLALVSHGLQVIFFIRTWGMDGAIDRGEFDRLLVRPTPVLFGYLTSYVNLIGVIDLAPAFVILAWAGARLSIDWNLATVGTLVMVVIGGTLLRAGLYLVIGSTAFWTRRSREMIGAMIGLSERGSQWPLHIYSTSMQWTLTFVLPLAFIGFYPAASLFGAPPSTALPSLSSPLWTLPAGLVIFLIGMSVFRRGMRRYDSPGS